MPETSAPAPLLVLVAMPEEAAPLTSRLEDPAPVEVPFPAPVAAVRGRLAGTDAVVVTTGIGVAAATAAATWGILTLSPALVVAAGSCGGLAADVEVGTVIVGESFAWSIADATAFGYAPGQLPGGPERIVAETAWADRAERAARAEAAAVRRGLMLAGDAFVTAPLADPMRERFPGALSADMETTATARTAGALGVPFVALRAVSDLCGPAAGQQFHLEIDVVAETSARAVERLAADLAG
ncbi:MULTISPECIES: 5'-methylthioadenosine/S-adenosylhomocysteine nucleosidase [Brachybacterium]|uniref:5'-methylthioadenosine/S-adenosylhomocysteine nucleosidase n=1 Tax=Brachybacterium TaxID=43668 RepID=UPI0021DFADC6|nr:MULTISPECIES: 5'-methylthioadenosine/S-adenosylhomocysteine nucleosidase [Brachybacterium]WME23325.1 5'-methylthioadenosine/S-adenosylhomocysteine nucleosidase [Brachybacterium sp. GU-2]